MTLWPRSRGGTYHSSVPLQWPDPLLTLAPALMVQGTCAALSSLPGMGYEVAGCMGWTASPWGGQMPLQEEELVVVLYHLRSWSMHDRMDTGPSSLSMVTQLLRPNGNTHESYVALLLHSLLQYMAGPPVGQEPALLRML